MSRNALTQGLEALPQGDKRLLKSAFAAALAALVLGVAWGVLNGVLSAF